MQTHPNATSRLYALLIGIDCYLPNALPGGGSYESLRGCVRDITQVEEFLQSKLGLDPECILKLTASNNGTTGPPEPYNKWPTYKNIVAAFHRLTDIAQSGDQVYIHYSGHGGRTPALIPKLKANGLDESLVPTDIGNSEARYLRDIELVQILNKMVEKGVIVTVVLDSCHSGGMLRGKGGATVRGINEVDKTERPLRSLVASDVELAETWARLVPTATRNLKLGSGWLPEPKGYVLLSACRPSELAYEYAFDGTERNGALTYWLIDSLKQIGLGLTYKQIHDRVVAKVHSQFQQQTPQLQGEGNREVFGSAFIQQHSAVNVMQTDLMNQRILLNTGQVQSVRQGTKFAVYPLGTTDFSQVDKRVALVEITELGATDSWAAITVELGKFSIEPGFQAVLLELNNTRIHRKARLTYQESLPEVIDQRTALQRVENSLQKEGKGFLELVKNDETTDYQIVVNSDEEYEVWDSGGQQISNLRPALRYNDQGAAICLIKRLVHLAKFYNILQLDNADPLSPLSGKLIVELAGIQSNYDPEDPPPSTLNDPGNTPTLQPSEWIFVRVWNKSSKVLNIAALGLQSDWSITQIYPSERDTDFLPLDPDENILIPLQVHLPPGYTDARDTVKFFATIGPTNFRWLELPPLDQPSVRSSDTPNQPQNALEELLASVAPVTLDKRHLNIAAYPCREWETAQIEINTSSQRSDFSPPKTRTQSAQLILKHNGLLTKTTFKIIKRALIGCLDNSLDIDLRELPGIVHVPYRHAVIWCHPSGQWFITDLKFRNGTFIRTTQDKRFQRISSKQILNTGDEISLGNTNFMFLSD